VLTTTGRSTDLALEGPGFFTVDGPAGPLYTRNGNFRIAPDGRLVTQEGYEAATAEPQRIRARPDLPVHVDGSGRVTQEGQYLGQLRLAGTPPAGEIRKQSPGYFSWASAAPPAATSIRQGALESSNTSPAESSVRLIHVLRQFEALQRALQLGSELNKRAVEEVARIGN
jgi:flagellar basal body rod protein FlgG